MKIHLYPARKARIEMLPLIDIVFLLLVFFIYAMLSMAVHRGLPIELPVSTSAEIDKKLVLSVTLKSDGTIYIDKVRVELKDLAHILKTKARNENQVGVLFFADKQISYQKLFGVLDRIKEAGIRRISLQAEGQ